MTGLAPAAPRGISQVTDYGTREAWLAARRRSLGASDSAALFEVSPWESPLSVWLDKMGGPTREVTPEQLERMEWGQLLEPAIGARYAQITGRQLWQFSPYCIAVHPERPHMTSTPDNWILTAPDRPGEGLLEIKTSEIEGPWENGPPIYYQCQVQHQLAVTGRDWGALVVLLHGNKLQHWDIERNEDFIAHLYDVCDSFWKLVEAKTAPPATPHKATLDALKRMHPLDNGETIELPGLAAARWEALLEAKARIKAAEDDVEAAEIALRDLIGPNSYGRLPDGRVLSLVHTDRKAYDVHYQATTYRSLREEKRFSKHLGKRKGAKRR